MSNDTKIELEKLDDERDSSSTSSARVSFKTTAMVAAAVKRSAKKSSRNNSGYDRMSWSKKRTQLSLEMCTYESNESTIPIYTLAAEGKLDELKSVIEAYNLTLKEVDKNGYTLLHHAASHNQEDVMQYLIDSGIDLDAVDNDGNTALHLATENECVEACHMLFKNGASDSILNKEILAPIHIAAQGRNKSLAAILDHPIDFVLVGYRNRTPLHILAECDNVEGVKMFHERIIVRNLKNYEFRLCAADDDGLTPIHLAARKNSYRVLEHFIHMAADHGYSLDIILGFLDEENSTPLHAAVDSGNTEVVEVLLKHGASPIDSKGDLIPPLHLACSQGRSAMVKKMVQYAGCDIISHVDQQQRTPLHYCALSIHSSCMIGFIVEKTKGIVSIDAQDSRGRTALHNAITSANLSGTKELLTYGADPLANDNNGLNGLHLALRSNRKVIVNALLELPVAAELVSKQCCGGFSAFHLALSCGHGELIPKMIVAVEYEIENAKDSKGNNYLHLAAKKGNAKALTALMDVPAMHKLLNEPNNSGFTPLHSAASGGHHRCVDLLLNNGAMFHKSFSGETAFLIACSKGYTDCAKLLLQAHPCQLYLTDDRGNTALHAAAQSKTPSMVTLILDKGGELVVNDDAQSFFDLIIEAGDYDCAMAVVNHDRWQECLDLCSSSHPSPMVGLIEQMPKVAKAVLDRCHTKTDDLDKSHRDYLESFDFKYLYLKKADETTSSRPYMPSRSVHPEHDDENLTTVHYKGSKHRESIKSGEKRLKNSKLQCGKETMLVLEKMKFYKRVSLLTHPVVNAFIDSKWKQYGLWIYSTFFFFQFLLVIFLSTFVGIVPNPSRTLTPVNETDSNSTGNELPNLSTEAQVVRAIALFFNLLFSIRHVLLVLIAGMRALRVFKQFSHWIAVTAVILNFIFLLAPNPLRFWQVGAFACFFSWFSLLLGLEFFALSGTIVKMFLAVTKTVVLVLFMCVFLLFAFAFSFYMLAGNLSEFSNVGFSFLSMFGFMLGELPYDSYIRQEVAGNLPHGSLLLFFILLLAILMSIVIANLLIGLAIGDIERIKLSAILDKKATEIDFFSQLDKSLPKRYLNHVSHPTYTVYPNRTNLVVWLWHDGWKWFEEELLSNETEQTSTTSPSGSAADYISEISELKIHVLELKETIQQIQESSALFRKRRGSLSGTSSLNSIDFDQNEEFAANYLYSET